MIKEQKNEEKEKEGKRKEKEEDDMVYVGISDTGKGISSKMMSKLFEKFTTDSDFGTGLGLFITKKISRGSWRKNYGHLIIMTELALLLCLVYLNEKIEIKLTRSH